MPERRFAFFIEDLLESVDRIEGYIQDQTKESFSEDQKTVDAVIRNLEIIGEACTHIPEDIRERYPEVPWTKVVGLRNVVIHHYFGVDYEAVFETIQVDLPVLKQGISNILADSGDLKCVEKKTMKKQRGT